MGVYTYIYMGKPRSKRARGKGPGPKKIEQAVTKVLNRKIEKKHFYDFAPAGGKEVVASWTIDETLQNLTQIAIGTDYNDRVGDQVKLVGLKGRIAFYAKGTATTPTMCRLLIFRWNENTVAGNDPSIGDIVFDSTTATQGHLLSGKDPYNKKQFHVYLDKIFYLTAPNGSDCNKVFDIDIKLHNSTLQFDSGLTVGTGHIYMGFMSDKTTGTNTANAYWHLETIYQDL